MGATHWVLHCCRWSVTWVCPCFGVCRVRSEVFAVERDSDLKTHTALFRFRWMFFQIPQGNIWASNSKQNKKTQGWSLGSQTGFIIMISSQLTLGKDVWKCTLVNPNSLLQSPEDFWIFEYHLWFTSARALQCFLLTCNPCMYSITGLTLFEWSSVGENSKEDSFWTQFRTEETAFAAF